MGIYVLKYLADFADCADFFDLFCKNNNEYTRYAFKFCLSEISEIKD